MAIVVRHPVYATTLSFSLTPPVFLRMTFLRLRVHQFTSSADGRCFSLSLSISLAPFFFPGNAVSPSVCKQAHTPVHLREGRFYFHSRTLNLYKREAEGVTRLGRRPKKIGRRVFIHCPCVKKAREVMSAGRCEP